MMNTLDEKKFECKASLNNKILAKEISKDLGSGHNINE